MHIDYLSRRLAVVGGNNLSLWNIDCPKTKSDTTFSLSKLPIPQTQVKAINKSQHDMGLRTVHLLPNDDCTLLSFVETDIANISGHL